MSVKNQAYFLFLVKGIERKCLLLDRKQKQRKGDC